jgi:hypothetical protein
MAKMIDQNRGYDLYNWEKILDTTAKTLHECPENIPPTFHTTQVDRPSLVHKKQATKKEEGSKKPLVGKDP